MPCGTVHVRLYPPDRRLSSRIGLAPFGFLHLTCHLAEEFGEREGWDMAASVEEADEAFPEHRLFKCSLSRCYGPSNDRAFPPEWRRDLRPG